MKGTVSAEVSNRKAGNERELLFAALEAFANLGDEPNAWTRFIRQWPQFLPDVAFVGAANWNFEGSSPKSRPPIYWFRNAVRSVWSGADANGALLNCLLGIDSDFSLLRDWDDSIRGGATILSPARPRAHWQSGEITLAFNIDFQRALFALMKDHWRAKVCPECSRYFIANKTAQAYCSSECYGESKRKRALSWWRRAGSANRTKAAKIDRKQTGRSSKRSTRPAQGRK